jgi:ABC-type transport system involved in cytochrome c biogenesis permease subunit
VTAVPESDAQGESRGVGGRVSGAAARSIAVSVFTVVVFLALYLVAPLDAERWRVGMAGGLVAVVAILPITAHRVRGIRQSDHPVSEAVEAVALVTSAVIFGFAATYYAISQTSDQIPGIETKVDSLYFTVTTLATVGFGDIVATGQTTRAVVTLQILVNLTLVGTAIRLIGSVATERHREGGDPTQSSDA